MTTYATARPTRQNFILDPQIYWRVSAFALSAVALLGIILASISGGGEESAKDQALAFHSQHGLGLTWTHNVVHVVLALAAFLFGFANISPGVSKTFAILFGFVYVALGVIGFLFSNPLGSDLALDLGVSLNVVHLLLGAWALTAGFGSRY
ncbi:MAG TPA: hypothetical protein VM327_01680 [Candidatus Thermoplasmatota archaeon]|nr:hypothetical protein [Candidatus Thermoplasmatota archaeon]